MKGFNSWISGIKRCASLLSITRAPARALEWSDRLQAALGCRPPRGPSVFPYSPAPSAPRVHTLHPVRRAPRPRGAPRRLDVARHCVPAGAPAYQGRRASPTPPRATIT